MKALATLSKYLGYYDKWKNIIQRYQLKWSDQDTFEVLNDVMMNNDQNYSSMIEWLNCCSKVSSYSNILLFNIRSGLRPHEAWNVRKDSMILELLG